jgi:cytochrome P450
MNELGEPIARLMRPETKAGPYPLYADVRRRGLVRSPPGPWVTSSHATATSVLRDRRFGPSPVHRRGYRPPSYPAGDRRAELPSTDMITMDPPDRTRLRRLVSSAFCPKAPADAIPLEFLTFAYPLLHLLGVPVGLPTEERAS